MQQIDWLSCRSEQMPSEQRIIENWVKDYQEKRDRDIKILEIGSHFGQSTALLAQFGYVLAIDIWIDSVYGFSDYSRIGVNFPEFLENMKRLNLMDRVFPVCSTSKYLYQIQSIFEVVYIDACHYYDFVKEDIERSWSHVAYGGLLMFDDYAPGEPGEWEGVSRAVDEFLKENKEFEVQEHINAKLCLRRINA
jgi:SAM-dependent methyltransferase